MESARASPQKSYDVEVMKERALIHRAVGERGLAQSLDAHLRAMVRLKQVRTGRSRGSTGWGG
eukprot:360731-Chlamydomonas_euryale.AAC.2